MYHRTTLSNGLTIVCETIPYVHSVSMGFWVTCGSRNETAREHGISHFIEHMAFKGTARRNAKEIAEAIDAVGGQLNAFTTKEYTCFYAKVLDQHLDLGMDLLADMIISPCLAKGDITKEKNVIEEEIKSYEDSPDEMVHDLFAATVLANHPLGHTILGTPETVSALRQKDLLDYRRRFYTPDNACLALAGNIDFDKVVEMAEGLWSGLTGEKQPLATQAGSSGPKLAVRRKDTEQVQLCLGTEGFPRYHKDKYNMLLLDSILGGSVSSRLFQELREERGLVYSTGSHHASYMDTGIFTVYAGTSPGNTSEVINIVRQQLDQLMQEPVKPEELRRAKEQLKGNLWLSLENTSNRMSRLAKSQLFSGQFLTPDEVVAKIEDVTADAVMEAARNTFPKERRILAAVGPFEESLPEALAEWGK